MRLESKVAMVTGGGSGIGRAICLRFAAEGARVVVGDIEEETAAATAEAVAAEHGPGRALPVACDVTKGSDLDKLVEAARALGRLDVVVHNAGMSDMGSVGDIEYEKWLTVMDVNLNSHVMLSQRVLPVLIGQGGGRMIHVASAMGLMAHKMSAAYSVSKAGVVQLVKQMALDYGEENITVNAICPGIIHTRMTGFVLLDEEMKEFYESVTPLKRIGTPEDVAAVAAFLASDDASFITGAAIPVDGGVIAGTDVLLGPR
ncbi:MAG: SDR family oxidoreductase [Deltaproteobacteria bacterium]|nr:SDR family oxidoreductase [Deltaproteobacteria bacterium]